MIPFAGVEVIVAGDLRWSSRQGKVSSIISSYCQYNAMRIVKSGLRFPARERYSSMVKYQTSSKAIGMT